MKNANDLLKYVNPNHYFKLHKGGEIASIEELLDALKVTSDTVFRHHVKKGRNDFASWVKDIIRDEELAEKIKDMKTKPEMINIIRDRYYELKNEANKNITRQHLFWNMKEFLIGCSIGLFLGLVLARAIM